MYCSERCFEQDRERHTAGECRDVYGKATPAEREILRMVPVYGQMAKKPSIVVAEVDERYYIGQPVVLCSDLRQPGPLVDTEDPP